MWMVYAREAMWQCIGWRDGHGNIVLPKPEEGKILPL